MGLTDQQREKVTAAERALQAALDVLPAATNDTDQASARQVLLQADRLICDHLPEVRARDVEIGAKGAALTPERPARKKAAAKPAAKKAARKKAAAKKPTARAASYGTGRKPGAKKKGGGD